MTRPPDSHGDWVLWRREGHNRPPLYLAPGLASELDAECRRRREEKAAAETAEQEELIRTRRAHAAIEKARVWEEERAVPIGPHRPHPFEVIRHQVLPDIGRLMERVGKLREGLYGDKELSGRELKALGGALERGAERSIVRPPDWRPALDDLAVELPAFRAAIEVVLHALALSDATAVPPSIPPLLLLGPPGVGKSYFCRRLAETLDCGSKWLAMDQPTAGSDLRGTDKHWANARHGALFELLALGQTANPLVILDEIDKAARRHSSQEVDPLAQLYSVLEPETSRRIADVSLDVELDASQVVYVATANGLRNLDAALLSRFEVAQIGLPGPDERRESARRIVESAMKRLGVRGVMRVNPGVAVLLADYTPRVIQRVVEKAVGAAVVDGRQRLSVDDMEVALGLAERPRSMRMH